MYNASAVEVFSLESSHFFVVCSWVFACGGMAKGRPSGARLVAPQSVMP